ncbi:MAG: hypothetical protein H3C25_11615, partial [Candidatus Brocadia sapporoensis]|nr:hypothetical protein [Candidatus Brocadia sapporoensis]
HHAPAEEVEYINRKIKELGMKDGGKPHYGEGKDDKGARSMKEMH